MAGGELLLHWQSGLHAHAVIARSRALAISASAAAMPVAVKVALRGSCGSSYLIRTRSSSQFMTRRVKSFSGWLRGANPLAVRWRLRSEAPCAASNAAFSFGLSGADMGCSPGQAAMGVEGESAA